MKKLFLLVLCLSLTVFAAKTPKRATGVSQTVPLGEVITVAPNAMYLKSVSGTVKAFRTDADYLEISHAFAGFFKGTGTIDLNVNIRLGEIDGFTGLTAGKKYYTGSSPGQIVKAGSAVTGSTYIGYALSVTKIFAEKNYTQSWYTPMLGEPSTWLSVPPEKDLTENLQLHHQDCNSLGRCIRLYSSITAPAEFRFQYDTGNGVWQDSGTTFSVGTNNAGGDTSYAVLNDFAGAYHYKSWVSVDQEDSNHMTAGLIRRNTDVNLKEVWAAYSTNGGVNWSYGNSGVRLIASGGVQYFAAGIATRANKSVIITNRSDDGHTQIWISNNTGSGYTTWTGKNITQDYRHQMPTGLFIAYNAAWTDDDKYKIITVGTDIGSDLTATTFDGAGNNEEIDADILGTSNWGTAGFCIDSTGSKNKVIILSTDNFSGTRKVIKAVLSDDVEGSITFTDKGDIQGGGGSAYGMYNGYTTSTYSHLIWNINKRCVYLGNTDDAYVLFETLANPSARAEIGMFYSKAISTSVWETKYDIHFAGDGGHNQEPVLQYIPSSHQLFAGWKYLPTQGLASNLTNGIILGRLFDLQPDGSFIANSVVQIDNGQAEAGFQGFLTCDTAGTDQIKCSWEHDIGARDTLWSQILQ